ncbi:ABC transporter permease [Roseicyclus sp.]|uniref:ABC transporter permease n=1 Tax=Roseicyclus sp. TaxID=1914329 RepID=UPI003F6B5B6E
MRTEAAKGLTLVSPTFVYALVLLAAPLAAIVLLSFWTQQFLTIQRDFTLANYTEALTDPLYRELMLRSLRISGLVTLVTVTLAFPVAYFISFHVRPERKSLWLFLITIPFWTSYLIRVFLWRVILAYDGPINSGLTLVPIIAIIAVIFAVIAAGAVLFWAMGQGSPRVLTASLGLVGVACLAWLALPADNLLRGPVIDEPLGWLLYNANSVVITLAHAFAPFAILPIFVTLEKIDRSLLEASRDLGESHARTFLRVTLPLAMPGVLAAVLIVFIPTVGDYVTPRLVGGSGGTMIATMIYAQIFDLNDRPMGATLAVLAMLLVAMVLLWGISRARAWLWLADRMGGGARGGGIALALAVTEIMAIRLAFLHGPALIGPAQSAIALVLAASLVSVLVLVRLPKGRWGI